ncbi:MAG: acyltransferase domain-containing protein, partial [Byssovorax sp.]
HVESFLAGHPRPGVSSGELAGRPKKLVFMFGGQGSQWLGMGRDLLCDEPAFRASLQRCHQAMSPYLGWSLLEVLARDDARLVEKSDVAQPCIFALQVALTALWQSLGIEPDAVVGQSMGEVAAAHVAGALSLDDAARIICQRSRIVSRLSGQGGMAVAGLSLEEAARALRGYEDRLSVAVSSSPRSTVLSGDAAALAEVMAGLQRQGVFCQHIKVDYASHSPYMDGLRDELGEALGGLRPRPAKVPFFSTVTGNVCDGAELDAAYWVRNLREPVLFARASELLLDHGFDVFLDVNPHPLLTRSVEQTLESLGREAVTLPSLRRGESGRAVLLDSLGVLYTQGRSVLWDRSWTPGRVSPPPSDPSWMSALGREPSGLEDAAEDAPELCVLSAHSAEALLELNRAMVSWLRDRGNIDLRDLCYTASVRRSHHEHRLAVVGRSQEELAATLDSRRWDEGSSLAGQSATSSLAAPRVVFVFPGQGSQWQGMGRRLLETEPVFRAAIEACEQALGPYVSWQVTSELSADLAASRLEEIDVVQPVLWAVQVALAALWRSWGIEPTAVVGHSLGEVAAAQVAGALRVEDAARVIALRSRSVRQHASGKGAMAVVELSFQEAEQAIVGLADRLAVGVSNGPRSSVLSGDPAALAGVLEALRERDVFCRPIKVDYASHSPQMDALKPLLLEALTGIAPGPEQIPFYSTVTAGFLRGEELDAAYWAANLREPVRFARAVQDLGEAGHAIFLEVSPHPALVPAIEDGLRDLGRGGAAIGSLRRDEDERTSLLTALGALYTRGAAPDFARLYPEGGRVVPLPAYPFQR